MIPFNALEQMNSKALALICADRGQHARPDALEIARNLTRIERPHSYIGMISVDDQRFPGAGDAERGGQAMRLAREQAQRLRGGVEIAGLVENLTFERERLISADAVGVRPVRAGCEGLGLSQFQSNLFNRAAARKMFAFDSTLVDIEGYKFSLQSGRRQKRPAAFAPRSQNQRSGPPPDRRRRG